MEPISTGFLGKEWGQLDEGRGTGCECEGSGCLPGAWVGDPREPEVSEAHLPPPLTSLVSSCLGNSAG